MRRLFVMLLAGCTPFGSDESDAGVVAADAAATDAPSTDAGVNVPPGCRLVANDDFTTTTGTWRPSGAALHTNAHVRLTEDATESFGAIWTAVPPGYRSFVARFTLGVKSGSTMIADGVTFAWTPVSAVYPPLGGSGADLGICGGPTDALALEMNTRIRELSLLDIGGSGCADGAPVMMTVTPSSLVNVAVTNTTFVATLTNVNGTYSLPATLPRSFELGYIGFTASTGGFHAEHIIDDIQIYVCP